MPGLYWELVAESSSDGLTLEREEVLAVVFSELSQSDQEILKLRYVEGLRNNEAADQLGLTQQAASLRLKRARDRLRKEYARRFER